VVPVQEIDGAVQEYVGAVLAASAVTLRLGKAAFSEQRYLDEPAAYDRATRVMVDNALRGDAQEGIQAFLHKRRPVWSGE
jgi:enoyl-CoA hydratase/carnithine racemase